MTWEGNEDPLRQNWLGTPMNLAILNGLEYAADFSVFLENIPATYWCIIDVFVQLRPFTSYKYLEPHL